MKDSCALFVALLATFANAEEKWIWSNEHKTDVVQSDTTKISTAKPISHALEGQSIKRKVDDDPSTYFADNNHRKARYEVRELDDESSAAGSLVYVRPRPYPERPVSPSPSSPNRPLPPYAQRRGNPFPSRPVTPFPRTLVTAFPSRPTGLIPDGPDEHNPLFAGNEENPVRREPSPAQSVGILTGPVPSWEKPSLHKNGDPTNFEHCKCSFSFNCKSPGIQFGSCDQGKTYCCYNEFNGINDGVTAATNTEFGNVDRSDRIPNVLVTPGELLRPDFISPREVEPLFPSLLREHVRDR